MVERVLERGAEDILVVVVFYVREWYTGIFGRDSCLLVECVGNIMSRGERVLHD